MNNTSSLQGLRPNWNPSLLPTEQSGILSLLKLLMYQNKTVLVQIYHWINLKKKKTDCFRFLGRTILVYFRLTRQIFLTLPHSHTPTPSPTLNTSRNSMSVLYYMCKYCRPDVRPSLTSRRFWFLTTSKYIAKNYILPKMYIKKYQFIVKFVYCKYVGWILILFS